MAFEGLMTIWDTGGDIIVGRKKLYPTEDEFLDAIRAEFGHDYIRGPVKTTYARSCICHNWDDHTSKRQLHFEIELGPGRGIMEMWQLGEYR